MKLPVRSPNLNAYAERFVRSIKTECLAKIIPLKSGVMIGSAMAHYESLRILRRPSLPRALLPTGGECCTLPDACRRPHASKQMRVSSAPMHSRHD